MTSKCDISAKEERHGISYISLLKSAFDKILIIIYSISGNLFQKIVKDKCGFLRVVSSLSSILQLTEA